MHDENEKVKAGRSLLADHILAERANIRRLQAEGGKAYDNASARLADERLRLARTHLWSLRVIAAEFSGSSRQIPYPEA